MRSFPVFVDISLNKLNKGLICRWFETSWRSCLHSLRWRHNGHESVWNHQPHDCLLNRLFRHRSKKTSKLRVTGLCVGNSPHKWPVKVTRKMLPFDDVIMYRFRCRDAEGTAKASPCASSWCTKVTVLQSMWERMTRSETSPMWCGTASRLGRTKEWTARRGKSWHYIIRDVTWTRIGWWGM